MNVDMITTFLNDFSTFWKNIWEFLKPIFNIIQGKDNFEKGEHLKNLNELANAFGKKPEVGEGYTPVEPAGSSKAE
ncbi:hypothetical protein QP140_09280 [Corynebacterium sp. UMB9976]|uniref:hypothetical protein n=1 Tax=Corynebacterium sp. UMB9976 TaxID=3046354 RepID=UPI00254C9308|nr:hypothetical protein [Corynebacterium sp. UMB9976]MDK6302770.1 hypothetical protein [Corynebacterium sp. UMB9976]